MKYCIQFTTLCLKEPEKGNQDGERTGKQVLQGTVQIPNMFKLQKKGFRVDMLSPYIGRSATLKSILDFFSLAQRVRLELMRCNFKDVDGD